MVLGFNFLPRRKPEVEADKEPVKLYEELLEDTANCTEGSFDPVIIEPLTSPREEKKKKKHRNSRRSSKDVKFSRLEDSYAQFDLESKDIVWGDENGERYKTKPKRRSQSSKRMSTSDKSSSKRRSSHDKKMPTSRRKANRKNVLKQDYSLIDMNKFWSNPDPEDARRRETQREAQRVYLRWAQYKSMREYQLKFQQQRLQKQPDPTLTSARHSVAACLSRKLKLMAAEPTPISDDEGSLGDFVEYANELLHGDARPQPTRRHSSDEIHTKKNSAGSIITSSPAMKPRRASSRRGLTKKGSSRRAVDTAEQPEEPKLGRPQVAKRSRSVDNISADAMSKSSPPGSTRKQMGKRRSSRALTKSASVSNMPAEIQVPPSPRIEPLPPPRQNSRSALKKRQSFKNNKSNSKSNSNSSNSGSKKESRPLPRRQTSRSSLKKKPSFKNKKDESPADRPLPRRQGSRTSMRDSLKKKLSSSCVDKAEDSPSTPTTKTPPHRQNSRSSLKTWTNEEKAKSTPQQLRRSQSSSTLKKRTSSRSLSREQSQELQRRHSSWSLVSSNDAKTQEAGEKIKRSQSSRVLKKKGSFRSTEQKRRNSSSEHEVKAPVLRRKSSRSLGKKGSNRSLDNQDQGEVVEENTSAITPLQRSSPEPTLKKIPSCDSLGYETEKEEEAAAQDSCAPAKKGTRRSSLNNAEPHAVPAAAATTQQRRHSIHAPTITTNPFAVEPKTDDAEANETHSAGSEPMLCRSSDMASTRSLGDNLKRRKQDSPLVRCKSVSELPGAGNKDKNGVGEEWEARILAEQEKVEEKKNKALQEWEAYISAEQKKAEERLAVDAEAKEKAAAEWEDHIAAELKKAEEAKRKATQEWEAYILAEEKKARERLQAEAAAKKKAAEEWEAYILAELKKAEERQTIEEQTKKRTAKEWTAKLLVEERRALELRAAEAEAKRRAKKGAMLKEERGENEGATAPLSIPTSKENSVRALDEQDKGESTSETKCLADGEQDGGPMVKQEPLTKEVMKASFPEEGPSDSLQATRGDSRIKYVGLHMQVGRLSDRKLLLPKQLLALQPTNANQVNPFDGSNHTPVSDATPKTSNTEESLRRSVVDNIHKDSPAVKPGVVAMPTEAMQDSAFFSEATPVVDNTSACNQELAITPKTDNRKSQDKYLDLHAQVNKLAERKIVRPTKRKNQLLGQPLRLYQEAEISRTPKTDNRTSRLKTRTKVGDVPPTVVRRSLSPEDANNVSPLTSFSADVASKKVPVTQDLMDVKLPLAAEEASPAGKEVADVMNALTEAQQVYRSKIQEKRRHTICSRTTKAISIATMINEDEIVVLNSDDSSVSSDSSSSSSESSSASSSSHLEKTGDKPPEENGICHSQPEAGCSSFTSFGTNYEKQRDLIKSAQRKTAMILAATGASSVRRASYHSTCK